MKYTTAISLVLSITRTSEAIYLACCETTQECPQYYNTIESFVKEEETFNACCYPDEEPRLDDLPECVHPITTEDGVSITAFGLLPQTKLETNETAPELVEEITITEGNQEVTITLSESTITEETETAYYGCCAVASTIQPALRSTTTESMCPSDKHLVEGLTLDLALLDGAKTNMQVCCDAKTQANEVDSAQVLPCPNEDASLASTVEDITDVEDNTTLDEAKDNEEEDETGTSSANTLEADGSNSAGTTSFAAFGIVSLFAVIQTMLS